MLVLTVVCAPLMVVVSKLVPLIVVPVTILGYWRYCGATPGMLALGMKIVDASSGTAPGSARLALRFAAAVALAPLALGFLWIAVDRRKQGWHDKIARTVVINSED